MSYASVTSRYEGAYVTVGMSADAAFTALSARAAESGTTLSDVAARPGAGDPW